MDPFGSLAPQIDPLTGAQTPGEQGQGKFNRATDAIVQALRNWIETPGRAMKEGITTEQAADWAAPTALGMVLTPGRPSGTIGSGSSPPINPNRPFSDALALASPNGRMSGRALEAAQERIRQDLFGPQGLQKQAVAQPPEYDHLMRQAQEMRDLAARGMKPRAYLKRAEELEAKASGLSQDRAMTLGSGAGADEPAVAGLAGIRAYHGSPYDFDRFSLDKIGTGEGAQAYGHGLYFAENPATARAYRDNLSGNKGLSGADLASDLLFYHKGDYPKAIAELEGRIQSGTLGRDRATSLFDAVDLLKSGAPPKGRMYEVNIGAKPEQFLDWDRPPSAQPQHVRNAIDDVMRPLASDYTAHPDLGGRSMQSVIYDMAHPNVAGSSDRASAALRERGIPGIRYLDQGSRMQPKMFERPNEQFFVDVPGTNNSVATGKGMFDTREAAQAYMDALPKATSNYVVFDPGIVDILRKYGLAGATAVGAGGTAANDVFGSLAPQAQ